MFKNKFLYFLALIILGATGCGLLQSPIKETADAYEILPGTELTVILETPLSSNINQRGDTFSARLKEPFLKDNPILPQGSQIRGLVKQVTQYQQLGGRAGLVLIFDQIIIDRKKPLPLSASLNTDQGRSVIKIKGKAVKDAAIISGNAVVGAMMGKKMLQSKEGTQKGLLLGTTAGAGAVILSDRKEVTLPEGTELTIKLDESLFILK